MIRAVDPADPDTAEALAALQRAAYAVEAALIGDDVIPAMRETAAELAASRLTWLAEAAHDGALLAAVAYTRHGDLVDVHRLVVDPAAFRHGHASGLLAAVLDREAGARRAVVATAAANRPALALYERHGFTPAREREVAGGVRIVELERLLGPPDRP